MITKRYFGSYNGKDVYVYDLSGDIRVTVCELGATVLSLIVPDKDGKPTDVVLGMTNVRDMTEKGDYMGAVVGRCANRIADGRFFLNGKEYRLALNGGGNAHLHGGNVGFDKRIFSVKTENNSLYFTYFSPDKEEGYPGNLCFTVKYTLSGSELSVEYFAETDEDTPLNPSNHAYFNLNGENDGSILDNVLKINADSYIETDVNLIPTIQKPVKNTPFDFTDFKPIGRDIDVIGGYDHNFCLRGDAVCAEAFSVKTGIHMSVKTDMKGVQFYSGNFLSGQKGKSVYKKHSGFCLETQYYPNAINRSDFESPVLKKGEKFYSKTSYAFSVKNL